MYPIFGTPESYDSLNQRNKELLHEIFEGIEPRNKSLMLDAQRTVYDNVGEKGMIYIVREGIVSLGHGERILYFYDADDLFGLEQFSSGEDIEIRTDFAVIVDEYSFDEVLQKMQEPSRAQKWLEYLVNRQELLNIMVSISAQTKLEMQPETMTLQPGEIIIEQNSTGTDVFTLVEGLLEVLVDGVKVGEVMPDEIFGAMAALTETPRSATVRALEFSVILKLPRERFLDLMRTRPLTVLKMIEDMSRTIVSLNERVVKLSE